MSIMHTFSQIREANNDLQRTNAHLGQHLADNDINAHVVGTTIKVHSSDVTATKKHLKKLGNTTHNVVPGLNEAIGDDVVNKTEKLRKAGAKEMSIKDKILSIPRGFKAMTKGKSEVDANHTKEETDPTIHNNDIKAALRAKGIENVQGKDITHYKKGAVISHNGYHTWHPEQGVASHGSMSAAIKHLHTEQVQAMDEISKQTMGSYVKQASRELIHIGRAQGREGPASYTNYKTELGRKSQTRRKGIDQATNRLTNEANLDEVSKGTLDSYIHKSFAAGNVLHKQIATETDPDKLAALKAKLSKRNTGVIQAAKKYRAEEYNLEEAIDKEHPIYKEYQDLKKQDIKSLRNIIKGQHRVIDTSEFRTKEHAASHILHTKHGSRRMAAVFGESAEISKTSSLKDTLTQMAKLNPNLTRTWGDNVISEVMSQMQKLRDAHDRHMEKALAANRAGDDEKTKVHQVYMQKIQAKMQKLKQNEQTEGNNNA